MVKEVCGTLPECSDNCYDCRFCEAYRLRRGKAGKVIDAIKAFLGIG